jgi:hypothetical protein
MSNLESMWNAYPRIPLSLMIRFYRDSIPTQGMVIASLENDAGLSMAPVYCENTLETVQQSP